MFYNISLGIKSSFVVSSPIGVKYSNLQHFNKNACFMFYALVTNERTQQNHQ